MRARRHTAGNGEAQGTRGACSPEFVSVQPVPAIDLVGAELHADDVAAAAGLAHREAADLPAGDEVGQVLLLLCFRAPAVNLRPAASAFCAETDAHKHTPG